MCNCEAEKQEYEKRILSGLVEVLGTIPETTSKRAFIQEFANTFADVFPFEHEDMTVIFRFIGDHVAPRFQMDDEEAQLFRGACCAYLFIVIAQPDSDEVDYEEIWRSILAHCGLIPPSVV